MDVHCWIDMMHYKATVNLEITLCCLVPDVITGSRHLTERCKGRAPLIAWISPTRMRHDGSVPESFLICATQSSSSASDSPHGIDSAASWRHGM